MLIYFHLSDYLTFSNVIKKFYVPSIIMNELSSFPKNNFSFPSSSPLRFLLYFFHKFIFIIRLLYNLYNINSQNIIL